MSGSTARKSSRDKVRAHRERMRAQGMKLVQVWVPDRSTAAFQEDCRRQARLAARSPHAKDDQDFVDAISIFDELPD